VGSDRARPLLAVGFWLPGSGFARVLRHIAVGVADGFDVHVIGIGYHGPVARLGPATLHPSNPHGGDVFAAFGAAELAERLGARIVLLVNDLWMLHSYMRTLPSLRDRTRIVAYVPLDGRIVSDRLLSPLGSVDRFVVPTEFARRELSSAQSRVGMRPRVSVIPHAIDAGMFRPLAGGRPAARRQLFGGDPSWRQASFIVLNANRPLERKRIDLTIEGFALFARDKPPGVKLWLHHAHMDAAERAGIESRIACHRIADRVRLTERGAPPLSDTELGMVYNACDVGLNTAMGEGWGLVSFEHAATGGAQVVPASSACQELWDGAGELVPTEDAGVPRFSPLAMRVVSAAGVAASLERLYSDRRRLERMSQAARENAARPKYRPDAVGAEWRTLFDEVSAQ
jgi:glycosyltransferase involved in cell wall biosynthesis